MLAPRHETSRANDRLKMLLCQNDRYCYFEELHGRKFDLNFALKTVYMSGLIVDEMYPNQSAILPTPGASLDGR